MHAVQGDSFHTPPTLEVAEVFGHKITILPLASATALVSRTLGPLPPCLTDSAQAHTETRLCVLLTLLR